MYCRPDLRDHLTLHQFGWAMREAPYDFERETWMPASSARRFESGTPNMIGIHALDASLSLYEELGSEFVADRLAENLAYLESGLREIAGIDIVTPRDHKKRAGILTFRHADTNPAALHGALMRNRVICAARAGGIRLAPHYYTPQTVLEATLSKIRQSIQLI
jgi:selenocysteine lyase/cysteine desulfurase